MHTGKGNVIFLLILFPQIGVHFYIQLSKPFSFIRSKFDRIKQFRRHAPYLAIPPSVHFFSPHFSLLSQTKLSALRTLTHLCAQVPVDSLLDPLTRVKELQNYLMESSPLSQDELTKNFQPPALPSLVPSYQRIFLSDHGCSLMMKLDCFLSFVITLRKKQSLMLIGHSIRA